MSLFDFFYGKLVEKFGEEQTDEMVAAVAAVAVAVGAVAAVAVAVGAVAAAVAAAAAAVVFFLTFYGVLNFPELIPFLVLAFVLTEIFFWTTKKKPAKKQNTFHFTIKTKAIYFVESCFWIIQANGAIHGIPTAIEWLGINKQTIINASQGLGLLMILIAVVFIWIKINEQKFKKQVKK